MKVNTRDLRLKDKYMKEKNAVIGLLIERDHSFIAPPDYVAPKKTKKVFLPDDGTNYVGLIIGP
jgi:hypothetical protein